MKLNFLLFVYLVIGTQCCTKPECCKEEIFKDFNVAKYSVTCEKSDIEEFLQIEKDKEEKDNDLIENIEQAYQAYLNVPPVDNNEEDKCLAMATTEEFDPEVYFKMCSWFDMKGLYTIENNREPKNVDLVKRIETQLAALIHLRKEIVLNSLIKSVIFSEGYDKNIKCEWKEYNVFLKEIEVKLAVLFKSKNNDQAAIETQLIEKLEKNKIFFTGQSQILDCEGKRIYYLLNSFGSDTLTSDFDYSVYKFTEGILSQVESELELIKGLTTMLDKADKYIAEDYCGNKNGNDCLDANGYPENMIFYQLFFKFFSISSRKINIDELRVRNLYSSKIIRYCVVSQIYIKKMELTGLIDNDILSSVVANCYNTMYEVMKHVVTEDVMGKPHTDDKNVRVLTNDDLFHQDGPKYPIESIENVKTVFNEKNKDLYISHLNNLIEYFATPDDDKHSKFNTCIASITEPGYFLEIINPGLKNNKKVTYKDKDFNVYDDLFYALSKKQPNDEHLNAKTDQMNLPFLGGCHIWASEAYITFGALEIVKFEKAILSGDRPVRCDSLFESVFENFGMMLLHAYEIGHKSDVLDMPIKDYQSISDAVSKYFRRTMLPFGITCYNDYDQGDIGLLPGDLDPLEVYKTEKLIEFYNKITIIDTKAADKKTQYYDQFKQSFSNQTVKEFIKESGAFYKELTEFMFKNLNIEEVFYKTMMKNKAMLLM